jgi:hypothetical protein
MRCFQPLLAGRMHVDFSEFPRLRQNYQSVAPDTLGHGRELNRTCRCVLHSNQQAGQLGTNAVSATSYVNSVDFACPPGRAELWGGSY